MDESITSRAWARSPPTRCGSVTPPLRCSRIARKSTERSPGCEVLEFIIGHGPALSSRNPHRRARRRARYTRPGGSETRDMALSVTLAHRTYRFEGLRELMAKATPLRSGDQLAGVAAASATERVAAQTLLADVPLTRLLEEPLIAYEEDEVTRLIIDKHDRAAFAPVSDLTVGQFRERLLSYETTTQTLRDLAPGLTPEMVAALSKVCRNQDLILIAQKCQVTTRFRGTIGLPGRLSVRLQPNHPTDDPKAIAAGILDGLLYGCGDACIGINPATDNVANTETLLNLIRELIVEYEIPTQSCVLSHVTTTLRAIERGAPVDLVFQSIAGTQAANRSFGIDLKLLREAHAAGLAAAGGAPNV